MAILDTGKVYTLDENAVSQINNSPAVKINTNKDISNIFASKTERLALARKVLNNRK